MWLSRFTDYIIDRPWQTLLLVFAISTIPFVSVIGILIASYITLTKSVREGAILTIAATLPCFFGLNANQSSLTLAWGMIGFTVLTNVCTWIFSAMLRQQKSYSALLQVAALVGVLAVSIIHLAYPNIVDWWGKELQTYYAQAKDVSNTIFSASIPQSGDELIGLINHVKQYVTGYAVMLILLSAISTVVIADWWRTKVAKDEVLASANESLSNELHNIRLHQLTGFLFVIALGLAYLGNSVAIDILPIVCVLFFTAGLSLVHYLFGFMQSRYTLLWIAFFYALLIIGMPITAVLIVALALTDVWVDFRNRFRKA